MAWDLGALQTGSMSLGALQAEEAEPQEITPDSIGPVATLGAPALSLSSGNQTITPTSIGPVATLGSPELLGPQVLTPTGIGPLATLGEPTLSGAPVSISPVGIAAGTTLGEPRLANVISISPDSRASTLALGEPELLGQDRFLFPEGLGPTARLGPPTLQGGETGLQVFIAGVDRSRWLRRGTASNASPPTVRSQTRGRWTASVEFHNVPGGHPHHIDTSLEWIRPKVGMTFLLKEFGRTVFRGCLSQIESERLPGSPHVLIYRCDAKDKSYICDHRIVRRVFAAEEDAADVVLEILGEFLNGEGIALDPEFPASLGALGTPLNANITVTQAFDAISAATGRPWFIDLNQVLYFADPTVAEAAPFSVTESSGTWIDGSIRVRETLTDYRNVQIVVSNRLLQPGDGTTGAVATRVESYTLLDAGGGVGYQEEARAYSDFPLPDGYILVTQPIGSVLEVKINGVAKPVYLITDPAWEAFINESGFLVQAFFWTNPGTRFIAPVLALSAGDVIQVTYTPQVATASQQSGDPLEVTASSTPLPGEQDGTCGSGIFEHVHQVNDVETEDEADALATKLLEKFSVVPVEVRFQTDRTGLQVGQKLTFNVPRHWPDALSLFITGLSGRSPDGTDLGNLSSFRYDVTADNIGDRGNWVKFWEDFYGRTRHPRPLEATDRTIIVLGPGTAIVEAINFTNPGILGITGRLVKIEARFEDPPEDQDLIIDVKLNGASVMDSENIRIPAGSTATLEFTNFASPVIQGYEGDIITISTEYSVTGADPVAARNGTLVLHWSA